MGRTRAEPWRPRGAPRAVVLLGVLAVGCALRIEPLPIESHLDWALPRATSDDRPRLGVGRFEDARPLHARHGARPALRVYLLGVSREGENRTGDADFLGDVASGVRRDALATLAHSGVFSEIREIDFDDAGGEAWRGEPGLDYALVARIEEFTGVQTQSARMSPLAIGWLRNRFDPPVGLVSVEYRLYRAGERVWQERIETSYDAPDRTINQAVIDAMAVANEQLAQRLAVAIGDVGQAQTRSIPVRVLDGCGLDGDAVAAMMHEVSEVYERTVGLRFTPSVEAWRAPPVGLALPAVLEVAPPHGGIVLALARPAQAQGGEGERFGTADTLGRHAVVGCPPEGVRPLTAIHEIAHLMGAIHVRDRSSVMHAVAEFDARFFDPLNERILEASRERPFDAALPPGISRRLDLIYRAAERYPERVDPADLQAARAALARASAP